MPTAAVYARISLDRKEGAGVARQLADCRQLCTERGWEIGGEYVDNDVSAVRRKKRPEWVRLMADLDQFDALVAYHPDRLYRLTRDLEDLIDRLEDTGVTVATVKAGDLDLGTASGRMVARIVGATARHESERIGERVRRAKAERATEGRPPGGGFRPFGYRPGGMELEPGEAAAIRDAAVSVAAGGSVGGVVRDWNARGFTTTAGRPWTAGSVRRVLVSARIAGVRVYRGKVVGLAAWPAIIDQDTHRRLVVMVEGRKRGRPAGETSLLSALITCPRCLRRMYAGSGTYRCQPSTRGGCGLSSIVQWAADEAVIAKVDGWLRDPRIPGWLSLEVHPVDASAEVEAIERKLVDQARRWALDEITDDQYEQARLILNQRLRDLDAGEPAPDVPDLLRLREAWGGVDTAMQRQVIETVVESITLKPGRYGDPRDRVLVKFRNDR